MGAMEPLSEEAQQRIEALAKKISVAESLDREIQAELRGHIEDKVRGYLSGEVRVTEADALLLAEKRFGEAGVVKGMLQGVHGGAHAGSLGRRLVAAFAATVAASIMGAILDVVWKAGVSLAGGSITPGYIYSGTPQAVVSEAIASMQIILLWAILSNWRRRHQSGRRLWFDRWSWRYLVVSILMAISLQCVVCYGYAILLNSMHKEGGSAIPAMVNPIGFQLVVFGWVVSCATYAATAALWVWWSDQTPRTWRRMVATALCWMVTTEGLSLIFSSGGVSAIAGFWTNRRFEDFLRIIGPSTILSLQVEALMAILAVTVYAGMTKTRKMEFAQ